MVEKCVRYALCAWDVYIRYIWNTSEICLIYTRDIPEIYLRYTDICLRTLRYLRFNGDMPKIWWRNALDIPGLWLWYAWHIFGIFRTFVRDLAEIYLKVVGVNISQFDIGKNSIWRHNDFFDRKKVYWKKLFWWDYSHEKMVIFVWYISKNYLRIWWDKAEI